ncbi:MAG: asparagine synthetase B [Bacteroidales bacterium]|nr:asparagine synthetase B [Bacteroidales bacterium]
MKNLHFKLGLILFLIFLSNIGFAFSLMIPMDNTQKNHLKAYGIAYWVLQNNLDAQWLLNYRGGSFLFQYNEGIKTECDIRGVSYEIIADAQTQAILESIKSPSANMDALKLEKPPKIAVYSPKEKLPWDDAVTLALTYAEIPYVVIYDGDIVAGDLSKYDWLHLHHEDFTGQYGKFYSSYRNVPWYQEQVANSEAEAKKYGFQKVSQLKLFIAKSIRDYVSQGGFLFAMCSGTDSFDIALAAEDTDICESMFDGDAAHANCQSALNFEKTFAFRDFTLKMNPMEYEFSNIDVTDTRKVTENDDYFTLFEFSAKWDPVPTMLCQNHTSLVKGFMGQTTAFNKDVIKSNVLVLGENKSAHEARYLHGTFAKGTWTFYGGHDPEDYRHFVGDPFTDLDNHKNSPGYRLILNNVLFPAAKKKKQKT